MSSIKKFLTTHAGSLPRPKPLTQLYADRVAGLEIDESMLSDRAYQATKWVIEQQKAVGIDLPNNGEQGREAFFLYIQRRIRGFGGKGKRKPKENCCFWVKTKENLRKINVFGSKQKKT